MLGTICWDSKESVVVGGGFSGLLSAYHLVKQGQSVTLYEPSQNLGGLISTLHTESGIVESAAHSLLMTKPVFDFFQEIDLPFVQLNSKSKARYIFREGAGKNPVKRVPFQALRAREWLELIAKGKNKNRFDPTETLTLEQWALRHLGRPGLDYLVNPFLSGIYAASANELLQELVFPDWTIPSGESLFSVLKNKMRERRKNRIEKFKKVMVAPENGMFSLVERLENILRASGKVRIIQSPYLEMDFSPHVQTFVCTPAPVTAEILKNISPAVSNALKNIPYAPLVSVTVFLKRSVFRNTQSKSPPIGVGILKSKPLASEFILGVLFNSSSFPKRVTQKKFPDEEICSFTVMLGGTQRPEIVHYKDSQIDEILKNELPSLLGLTSVPIASENRFITRWERAIPVYGHALKNAISETNIFLTGKPKKNLILFGNYTGQVSLRGMIETWDEQIKRKSKMAQMVYD